MAKIARSLLVIGCGDTYPQGNRTRLCAVAFSTAPGDRTPNDTADVRLQPVLQERHDFGQECAKSVYGNQSAAQEHSRRLGRPGARLEMHIAMPILPLSHPVSGYDGRLQKLNGR
jgi:hypothetical protein